MQSERTRNRPIGLLRLPHIKVCGLGYEANAIGLHVIAFCVHNDRIGAAEAASEAADVVSSLHDNRCIEASREWELRVRAYPDLADVPLSIVSDATILARTRLNVGIYGTYLPSTFIWVLRHTTCCMLQLPRRIGKTSPNDQETD